MPPEGMALQPPAAGPDWHERRDELRCGMVFRLFDDGIIRLDRRVVGDGTRWHVDSWYGDHWSHDGETIEPGDLTGNPLSDPPA